MLIPFLRAEARSGKEGRLRQAMAAETGVGYGVANKKTRFPGFSLFS